MAIIRHNPTTPAQRHLSTHDFSVLTKKKPEKSLLAVKNNKGGRNAQGKISVRHIGGGNRQKYRLVDFRRNHDGVKAKVAALEYDPNRTANIALLNYADGKKSYILAPVGLNVGDYVMSGAVGNDRAGKFTGGYQTGFQMDMGIDKTGADDLAGHIGFGVAFVTAKTHDQPFRHSNVTGLQFTGEDIHIGGIFQHKVCFLAAGGHIDDVQFLDEFAIDLAGPGFGITHVSIPPYILPIIAQLLAKVKCILPLWC